MIRNLAFLICMLAWPAFCQSAAAQRSDPAGEVAPQPDSWEAISSERGAFTLYYIDAFLYRDRFNLALWSREDAIEGLHDLLDAVTNREASVHARLSALEKSGILSERLESASTTAERLSSEIQLAASRTRFAILYLTAQLETEDPLRGHSEFRSSLQAMAQQTATYNAQNEVEIASMDGGDLSLQGVRNPQAVVLELENNTRELLLSFQEVLGLLEGVSGMPEKSSVRAQLQDIRSRHAELVQAGRASRQEWFELLSSQELGISERQRAVILSVMETFDATWAIDTELVDLVSRFERAFFSSEISHDDQVGIYWEICLDIHRLHAARHDLMNQRAAFVSSRYGP
ncbi:hypothetical protein [Ponticaulis koreensis]|uniref:hypothetical protein n=1 Tax=Ponticaulis koreensis TaxID=1123045 RepID=UPI00041E4D6C|nr:hypothetical protein [Ponticaulis koreensis]